MPGGGIIHGESVEQALVRELAEEFGLPAQTISGPVTLVNADLGSVMRGLPRANLYYRVDLPAAAELRGGELEYKWVSGAELDVLQLSPATTRLRGFLQNLLQA